MTKENLQKLFSGLSEEQNGMHIEPFSFIHGWSGKFIMTDPNKGAAPIEYSEIARELWTFAFDFSESKFQNRTITQVSREMLNDSLEVKEELNSKFIPRIAEMERNNLMDVDAQKSNLKISFGTSLEIIADFRLVSIPYSCHTIYIENNKKYITYLNTYSRTLEFNDNVDIEFL